MTADGMGVVGHLKTSDPAPRQGTPAPNRQPQAPARLSEAPVPTRLIKEQGVRVRSADEPCRAVQRHALLQYNWADQP